MQQPTYPTLEALLAADERNELSDVEFDDLLWCFMIDRGGPVEHPEKSSGPVRDYVASRWMEWEVGNGGFAQAAYNIPDWFDAAADGYTAVGLPRAAARIRAARELIDEGKAQFTRGPQATIKKVFAEFVESDLTELDEGLDAIGWWAQNRAAFTDAVRPSPPRTT
jgi:hypothetical protein